MANIPYLELSYGTSLKKEYKRKRLEFGEGYSEREQPGLNSVRATWLLRWDRIPEATAIQLEDFFDGLGGSGIVDWTPYGRVTSLKWTATGWSNTPEPFGLANCQITLTQEFDL